MKNLFLALLCLVAFSCTDECKDVECGPGTCEAGLCICPTNFTGANCESCVEGYEGDDCLTEIRSKFIGTYTVVSTADCSGGLTLDPGGQATVFAGQGGLETVDVTLLFGEEAGTLSGSVSNDSLDVSGIVQGSNITLAVVLQGDDLVGSLRLVIPGLVDGTCPVTLEK